MLIVPSIPFLRRRARRGAGAAPAPPAAPLVLVEAEFDSGGAVPFVRLRFGRAIDIDAIDVEQVLVDDGATAGLRYRGAGAAALVDAETVRVDLADYDLSFLPGVTLTASDQTGIVASDDGGTWAGVSGLGLPFP